MAPSVRPKLFTLVVALAAALATLVVSFAPWVRLAYPSRDAHMSLETAAVLIAFVAAVLVHGRFHARRHADDLVLACALFALTTANFLFAALPKVLGQDDVRGVVWSAAVASFGVSALFIAAAFTPPRVLRSRAAALLVPLAATLSLLGIAVACGFLLFADVPLGIAGAPSPESAARPLLVGHPLLLGSQLACALAFAVASAGFVRKAARNELAGWLAAAAALAAFARLNYFLFPSIYSNWFHTGDFFRLAFYACLLIAAVQEIRAHFRGLAQAAVLEERRRLARDLHDGVAQELAYIRTQARRGSYTGADVLTSVANAAERALDESRRAIAALTTRPDDPLHIVLGRVAEDVAARAGGRVVLDLDEKADASPELREELLRILSEAMTNAFRHGGTEVVSVVVRHDPLTLQIHDQGRGFDTSQPGDRGFGLTSMRERAGRIGADLSISSRPGGGTELEVVLL